MTPNTIVQEQTANPVAEMPVAGPLAPTTPTAMTPRVVNGEAPPLSIDTAAGRKQALQRMIVCHSEQIDQLIGALAIAQGGFEDITRSRTAHVESKRTGTTYDFDHETLEDVIKATKKPLSENGLAVLQFPFPGGGYMTIRTMLAHKSGQWIYNDLSAEIANLDPQVVGSGITYLMRYARKAILGLAAGWNDDDGNRAAGNTAAPPAAPDGFDAWLLNLETVADNGIAALTKFWNDNAVPANAETLRLHLLATDKAKWDRIKNRAREADVRAKKAGGAR